MGDTHKEWLFGKTIKELEQITEELGAKRFVAKQITEWLYAKRIPTIDCMSNLSKDLRKKLSQNFCVGRIEYSDVQCSVDGTKKYLFPTLSAASIESAYIPDKERATLCVSSQAGCKMGCKFCMTARQGFIHNLSVGEILNQICSIDDSDTLTNVVYMGMGEPLDNIDNVLKSIEILTAPWGFAWSPTRITLSTIGVIPNMVRFMDECKAHLAVSLHTATLADRLSVMPVQNKYNISEVVSKLKSYDWHGQRRLSFEYIMFDKFNDTPSHAAILCRMLKGLNCRVNLIRFHSIPDFDMLPSKMDNIIKFKDIMNDNGFITTIRASRGEDIFAACGMLSTKDK